MSTPKRISVFGIYLVTVILTVDGYSGEAVNVMSERAKAKPKITTAQYLPPVSELPSVEGKGWKELQKNKRINEYHFVEGAEQISSSKSYVVVGKSNIKVFKEQKRMHLATLWEEYESPEPDPKIIELSKKAIREINKQLERFKKMSLAEREFADLQPLSKAYLYAQVTYSSEIEKNWRELRQKHAKKWSNRMKQAQLGDDGYMIDFGKSSFIYFVRGDFFVSLVISGHPELYLPVGWLIEKRLHTFGKENFMQFNNLQFLRNWLMKKYIPNYLSEQSDDDLRRVLNNTYLTIRYWMLTIRDPSIVDKTNSGRCGDINMHLPGKLYDAAGIPVCFRITQKSHEATLIPPNSYFEKRAAFDRVIEEIEAAKAAKDEAKFKELRAQKLKLSKYLQSWGDIQREFTEVDFDGFPDEWKGAVVLDGWRKQAYTLEEWMKGNADKPPYSMMKYYDYLEKK